MNAFSQDQRMGRLSTELGKDVLVLQRFEGIDRMSGLFEFGVSCLAATSNIDFDKLIGTHATVTLIGRDRSEHFFDGIVTEARWMGVGENGHRYHLTLRPWLFLAGLRRNQRIFHEKSVIDILQELLSAYADAGTLAVNVSNQYPVLEYTVQYRESDLAFACRLMERHGISYHFKHSLGAHEMILTDSSDNHQNLGAFPYRPVDGHHQEDIEHLWEWFPARRISTGAIRLTDYNFKTPTTEMEKEHLGRAAHPHGQIESFDWPGDYLDPGRGAVVAQLRLDREQGNDRRFEALGDIINLTSGKRFSLTGDEVPGHGDEYLCLVAHHSYTSDNYGTGGTQGDGYAYTGRYVLMPSNAPLLPERKTPLADVRGPQTAVVVGEGEIDCDEYGRILVKFHWDLAGAFSMRCRVSQNWASNGWGGMVIPRIGMEVVVEFLDGDPDKPLITGCVFNGKNKVPYDLPAHKTKSVFRTDTHKAWGFNEVVFEDEKGKEHIAMKAQKDASRLVLNDSLERIKRHDVHSVGANQMIEVGANQKTEVGGSLNLTVGGTGPAAKGLLSGLSGLASLTKKLINKGASDGGGGGGPLGTFAGTVGKSALGFLNSDGSKGREGLHKADETGQDANHNMRLAGSKLGESGASLFQAPGTMNTFVSNFRSDTTGIVSAEQIGLTKIVNVGGAAVEQVGKVKRVTVGKKLFTTVGEMILNRTRKYTLVATEKFTISAPGGSIEIDKSGMTIKAFQLKVLCPSVDFNPGAPSQSEVLKAEQAFCEECRGSVGG